MVSNAEGMLTVMPFALLEKGASSVLSADGPVLSKTTRGDLNVLKFEPERVSVRPLDPAMVLVGLNELSVTVLLETFASGVTEAAEVIVWAVRTRGQKTAKRAIEVVRNLFWTDMYSLPQLRQAVQVASSKIPGRI